MFFAAKTIVCTTNIITWPDGLNIHATVCLINNGTGGLYRAIINAVLIGWSCGIDGN
jgi:hypothetical protein